MGGDLKAAPAGKAPSFLVAAAKDPISGNLDRIQIVKGWLDKAGKTHEKIYDVVWSDPAKRKPGANGKLPPVGNTVDVKNATWRNSIGSTGADHASGRTRTSTPRLRAFYYARVIEIPTPRWTAFDAVRFKHEDGPRGADDAAGTRLHLADLVLAFVMTSRTNGRSALVAGVELALMNIGSRPPGHAGGASRSCTSC